MDRGNWEEALIGTVLLDSDCYFPVNHILPQDLLVDANKEIWKVIGELSIGGRISKRTVVERLREKQILDKLSNGKCKGEDYIDHLATYGDSVGILEFAKNIEEYSIKRQISQVAAFMSMDSKNGKHSEEIIADYVQKLVSLRKKKHNKAITLGDLLPDYMIRAESLRKGEMNVPWYPRMDSVRELIPYFDEGDFAIIPAYPGGGKSTYLRYEALRTAMDGEPVLFLNFENPNNWFMDYAIAYITRIDSSKIRNPKSLTESEYEECVKAGKSIANLPLHLKKMGNQSINEVISYMYSEISDKNIKVIMIDHLQIIGGETDSKYQTVLESAQLLRAFAQETNIPILCSSQMKREGYTQPGVRPKMSSLQYAGEGPAKKIIAPFRQVMGPMEAARFPENIYNGKVLPEDKYKVVLLKFAIIKNSNGMVGDTEELALFYHLNDFKPLWKDWRNEIRVDF